MATQSKTAPAGTATKPALRVVCTSPIGSMRRAGISFGREPTLVPLDTLSKQQIAAITAEPLLDVSAAEMPGGEASADQSASVDGKKKTD